MLWHEEPVKDPARIRLSFHADRSFGATRKPSDMPHGTAEGSHDDSAYGATRNRWSIPQRNRLGGAIFV